MNNFRQIVALGILGAPPSALHSAQAAPTAHVYRVVESDSLIAYVLKPAAPGPAPRPSVLL